MIEIGVDEMTLVVMLKNPSIAITAGVDWRYIAEQFIEEIESELSLLTLLGERQQAMNKTMQGYSVGYFYGSHNFYFMVCYHDAFHKMGVAIRFSAKAWTYYQEQYINHFGKYIEAYEVLKKLRNRLALNTVRFSRIDVFADYINEEIAVDDIHKLLEEKEIEIRFATGRKNPSTYSAISNNGIVNTIYIGSHKKKNIKTFLRIYNKKFEQIQNKGVSYKEAIVCRDWVRFENVIRGKYAHQVSEEMARLNSRDEQSSFLAELILNKYSFYKKESEELTNFSRLLKNVVSAETFYYTERKYKDHSLEQSFYYLLNNSGLSAFVYKLKEIEPPRIDDFFQKIYDHVNNGYSPSVDVKKWLDTNMAFYRKHGLDFLDPKTKKGGIS